MSYSDGCSDISSRSHHNKVYPHTLIIFCVKNRKSKKKVCKFAFMREEIKDFVDALESYVKAQLLASGEPADYNVEALEITDARNHLFRPAGKRATDEAENIYALRDLCRVDETSLDFVPDRQRMEAIARNFFYNY